MSGREIQAQCYSDKHSTSENIPTDIHYSNMLFNAFIYYPLLRNSVVTVLKSLFDQILHCHIRLQEN